MEAIVIGLLVFIVSQIFKGTKKANQNRPGQKSSVDLRNPTAPRKNPIYPSISPTNSPNDVGRQIMEAFGQAFDDDDDDEDDDEDEVEKDLVSSAGGEGTWQNSMPNVSSEGECYDEVHEPLHARFETPLAPRVAVTTARHESKGEVAHNAETGMASIQGTPIDAQQMRMAFIMAEIIGPPKSRRRPMTRV